MVSLLADILLLLKSGVSLMYFSFKNVPNLCNWLKFWTADRPFKHRNTSTTKPCCFLKLGLYFSHVGFSVPAVAVGRTQDLGQEARNVLWIGHAQNTSPLKYNIHMSGT